MSGVPSVEPSSTDDQLEVADASAAGRSRVPAAGSARRSRRRRARRRAGLRPRRPVAYGACRERFRRSTSSSRRSVASTSWGRCWRRSTARRTAPSRCVVVDQNEDDRLRPVLAAYPGLDLVHLRSPPGLSRARNVALAGLTADLVAFPDDDCVYADDLLERVARAIRRPAPISTGSPAGRNRATGAPRRRGRRIPPSSRDDNLWNRAISFTIFLRRDVVSRVGRFDERARPRVGKPWHSGEEIDYLVRALATGRASSTTPRSS